MNMVGLIEQNVFGTLLQYEVNIALVGTGITVNNFSGGGSTTEFIKTVAATSWHVMHNRGYKPVVVILDEFGSEIVGDISHNSVNDFYVLFNSAQKGSALYT